MKGISCWRGVFKHKRLPQRTRLSGGKNSGKVSQAYVTRFHHSWISSFFFLFFFSFFGRGWGVLWFLEKNPFNSQWNLLSPLRKGIEQTLPQKVVYQDLFISADWFKNRIHKVVKISTWTTVLRSLFVYNEGIVRISNDYFHYYFPCKRG